MEWSDAGKQLVAWAVVLWVLAAAAVALRLFSRGYILHVLGPTDWFIVVTLVCVAFRPLIAPARTLLASAQPP
jgi:MFS-type transporter involved in bile tolerance (Atg22 family)